MKRIMLLATVALMAMLVFAPAAMAQDTTMMEDTMMEETMMSEDTMSEDTMMMEETASGSGSSGDLADSGGPAILLPAAFLLLGSGILTYAVLRRR
ncbi:MAG: hypothetical protein M3475_04240 [Actinomycetota bacterium]|nr:hypothetical protein [Actinomycetota bacterium]